MSWEDRIILAAAIINCFTIWNLWRTSRRIKALERPLSLLRRPFRGSVCEHGWDGSDGYYRYHPISGVRCPGPVLDGETP